MGACLERVRKKFDGTAYYLISRIRCNNILIWILLHLILEIRYAPQQSIHNGSINSSSGRPYSVLHFLILAASHLVHSKSAGIPDISWHSGRLQSTRKSCCECNLCLNRKGNDGCAMQDFPFLGQIILPNFLSAIILIYHYCCSLHCPRRPH